MSAKLLFSTLWYSSHIGIGSHAVGFRRRRRSSSLAEVILIAEQRAGLMAQGDDARAGRVATSTTAAGLKRSGRSAHRTAPAGLRRRC